MNTPIVKIQKGSVRGFVIKNLDDKEFYSFLGIPYAKPPLGDLRFKPPQPLDSWTGVKDATKESPMNYQVDMLLQQAGGSEDSLHLNVFTKNLPHKGSLHPVMVWIHGGGFIGGSNALAQFGPKFLLTEDVVLVTINYRLGILGFIQAEDPSLELFGNVGLKDQLAALKWVQANIQNFGGDPNNVTVFGESAGGCSAQYLVLSKAAEGLFHKAIAQSGVVTNLEGWGLPQPNVKKLLRYVGKEEMTEAEALSYLRSLPVEELYALQETYLKITNSSAIWPSLEKPNPTAFFTEHPGESLVTKNFNEVPIINGYNSNELNSFANPKFAALVNIYKDNFSIEKVVSTTLKLPLDNEVCKIFCSKFRDAYEKEDVSEYQFYSDAGFSAGNLLFLRNYSKNSRAPLYLYKMSLIAGLNFGRILANLQEYSVSGASHEDDIGYLFKNQMLSLVKGSPEEKYVRNFVKLWTNFAKFGNPTPEENDLRVFWKPYTNDNEDYLEIDEKLIPGTSPDKERMQIWKELFDAAKTVGFF